MNGDGLLDCVSVLTPPGRGAIAVVVGAGPRAIAAADAAFRAANGRPLGQQALGRIVFGHWHGGGEHSEEMLVCRLDADRFELHCHGGVAAAARIVEALVAGGCREVPWQQWNAGAAPNLVAVEAEEALAAATTRRAAAILLDQHQGALADAARRAGEHLARGATAAAHAMLAEVLRWAPVGLRLAEPWRVALAGRPNVGKSSLMNALVGYRRAIVFDQPGTTRDVLTAQTAVDGWPVELADMAGLRESGDALEAEGVARAAAQLARADLVAWVVDAATLASAEAARRLADEELASAATDIGAAVPRSRPIVVLNKIDLAPRQALAAAGDDCVLTSAITGEGLDELLAAMAARLVPAAPPPGAAVPFTRRQVDHLERAAALAERGAADAARAELARLVGASPAGGV
jgi:tRNA modification GTPase